jgi:hypothetical protein
MAHSCRRRSPANRLCRRSAERSRGGQAALAGIAPFLENLKKLGRKNVPGRLELSRTEALDLLEQARAAEASMPMQFAGSSAEGRAIAALFDIAGKIDFFYKAIYRGGPWPPKKDGTWSPSSDAPAMTADDIDALANEGQR